MAGKMRDRNIAYRNEAPTSRKILLIGKYKQQAFLHLSVAEYAVQFLFCFVNSLSVLTVDYENETLSAGVIVSPQGTNLVLTSNVPNVELDILVGDGLHIEADCAIA